MVWNNRRICSANGGLPPMVKRKKYYEGLKDCFIHHENGLEAALMFMIIAFNLMQLFFFRRLKNFRRRKLLQIEVIEKIILDIVAYDSKGKYIIDSS